MLAIDRPLDDRLGAQLDAREPCLDLERDLELDLDIDRLDIPASIRA